MLNFYYRPACPYCQRVLSANEEIGAPLTLLDVGVDETLRTELIEKGGKKQVPFLDDTTQGVMMYESDDIITYLSKQYGQGKKVDVSLVGNVCPIE